MQSGVFDCSCEREKLWSVSKDKYRSAVAKRFEYVMIRAV